RRYLRPATQCQSTRSSRSGRFRRLDKFSGGLRRTTGIRQRVAESDLQINGIRAIRHQLDGAAEIERGAIEGQGTRRFARRGLSVQGCMLLFAGAEIVFIERLRIVQAARLDGLGQAAMNLTLLVV